MGPLTQWRGQSDTTLGRFGWGVLMSLLVHAPLTPLAALFGLLTFLSTTEGPPEVLPPMTGIPVDLIEGEEAEAPPPEALPAPAEPAVALEPPDKGPREAREPAIRDAGVADADPSNAEVDAADAGTEGDDAGVADGGITDPVAASGTERVADVNANVQMMIHADKIRGHALAKRVGETLAMVPQWSDFFGPGGLNPITDIDRLMLAGPQLRDSSEVTVVVKVNVPKERVRAAVDAIVRSDPNGGWVEGARVPTAKARVDRAPRFFVMPSDKIVIVSPPSVAEAAAKVGRKFTLPPGKGPEVAFGKLVTPWRAFRGLGLPIDVPKSIAWARFKVTLDESGGAIVDILAQDESPEKAAENAGYLERNLTALSQLDLGLFGALIGAGRHKFAEKITFTSKGDEIQGQALFTARQLSEILDFAPMLFGGGRQRPSRSRGERGKADASAPASPPKSAPVPESPKRAPAALEPAPSPPPASSE